MALWTAIFAIVVFGAVANAVPTIAFPLNSQVPPVARIGETFSYTFSNSTFSSTLPLSYDLSDAPQWLSLDSSTRTLSGTPSANDVGTNAVTGVNIDLTASDQTGSVTLNATLVVSSNPAPVISIPLSAQLASFGTSSLPSTILYHPSTNFSFKFDPDTFSAAGLNYYAVTLSNTPLPSWIQFDGSSLSFSGRTPDYQSLIQPPQTFDMQLIASDVEGFSAASMPFAIEVGVHLLAFNNAEMVLNAAAGTAINFDGLQNNLELDGAVIVLSSLASITAQTPAWMTFDNSTLILTGTVPTGAVSSNVTVQATDIYGDTDAATIIINTAAIAIWSSQIGSLNVTSGSPFSFNFSSYVGDPSDVEMTAQFSPVTPWIDFDSQTLIMSGVVPPTAPASKISVSLVATSKSSHVSASETFDLLIAPETNSPLSSSSSGSPSQSSASTSTSSTDRPISSTVRSRPRLSTSIIVAITIPISLLAVGIVLALLCCFQRRAAKKRPRSPTKSEISQPMEVSTSVLEVTRPTPVIRPEPLLLDTSGFIIENSTSLHPGEGKRRPKKLADNPLRRSQTMSAISGQLKADFRKSGSTRARSCSDNALSKTDRSWRSTQESAYPTISSSSRTNSSHRLTRNYSRKGQNRRSGRIKSKDSALRNSALPVRPQSTILNLGDSNFSFTPLDNFSVLSKRSSTQSPSDLSGSLQQSKSAKRKSRFVLGIDQRSGVGHGGREPIASLAALPKKRRSIGHGQNWESVGLPRDSRTWLTVNSPTEEQERLSDVSAITENTDVLEDQVAPLSIQTGPKTRGTPSSVALSDTSASARPVSRRAVGSSPFFAGGGSMRSSRKSRSRQRTSYADSPTVPEETMVGGMDNAVMGGLEDPTIRRDSFGISYGAARDGTLQLKSYIQSRLNRTKTVDSAHSSESRDSRFESADSLSQPQSQPNFIVHALSTNANNTHPPNEDEGSYEEYLPDDHSDESWETQNSPPKDSLGNIIEYGLGESPEVATVTAQKHLLAPSTALRSHPAAPLPPDLGPNARMVEGRGRRPLSVDAGANKGSVRAVVESDYAAYI